MLELFAAGGTPDSVVADFDPTAGQNVLEKPGNEFDSRKRDVTHLLGAVVAIAETDQAVVDGFQTAVGNRDAENVAAEIVEDLFATASVFRMNDPVLLPE